MVSRAHEDLPIGLPGLSSMSGAPLNYAAYNLYQLCGDPGTQGVGVGVTHCGSPRRWEKVVCTQFCLIRETVKQ